MSRVGIGGHERRGARCALGACAVALGLACAQAEQPVIPAPSPTPPMPTPHPVCAAALAQPPSDPWPPPLTPRGPAAVVAFGEDTAYLTSYVIDGQTGRLTRVGKLDYGDYEYAELAAAPSGDLAYFLLVSRDSVAAQSLRVGGDGQLAELPGAHDYPQGDGDPVFHPTRRLAYAGSTIYRVSLDGTLTTVPGKSPSSGPLLIHPNGVFAYAYGRQYCIGAEGIPQEVASYAAAGVAVLESSGTYLIALDDQAIYTFRLDRRTGLPTFVSSTPRTPSTVLRALAHPTRGFFYVLAKNGPYALHAYAVDEATGAVALIETMVAAHVRFNGSIDIDPAGRFLYEWGAGRSSGWALSLQVWRLEADGRLTAVASFSQGGVLLDALFFDGPQGRP